MRYFTKEWYELTNKTGYTAMLDIIEAENVSFKDIYLFKLDKELKRAKRQHNKKPKKVNLEKDYELRNLIAQIENDSEIGGVEEKERFLNFLDEEYQNALAKYNNREEFDEEAFIGAFNDTYQFTLKNINHMYPSWVLKEVDKRILALDLITKEAYEKLLKEEKENESTLRKIQQKAMKVLNRHALKLDEYILEGFNIEDAAVISFRQKANKDAVMKLQENDGFKKITFEDAEILEYDNTLKFGFNYYSHGKYSRCNYLFTELYKYKNYIEVHMMLENSDGCKYITLRCKDILIEEQN